MHSAIHRSGSLRDCKRFVGPVARYGSIPARFHLRSNDCQEIGGRLQCIGTDRVLNEAIVPDRVKVSGTLPACSDGVAASVIEKRNVQRLVNIADPMSQRFQGDQAGRFRLCSNTQNLEVAQDRRKNAHVSQRALVRGKSF